MRDSLTFDRRYFPNFAFGRPASVESRTELKVESIAAPEEPRAEELVKRGRGRQKKAAQ